MELKPIGVQTIKLDYSKPFKIDLDFSATFFKCRHYMQLKNTVTVHDSDI